MDARCFMSALCRFSTPEVGISRIDVDASFIKHEFAGQQEIAVEVAPARSRQSGGMADGLLRFCRSTVSSHRPLQKRFGQAAL